MEKQQYEQLVNRNQPKSPVIRNAFFAFLVGGFITTLGQVLMNLFLAGGLDKIAAGAATSTILIAVAALLTGLGVWDNIGKFAGAGAIVPITGFANSMVAAALEFKREGMVFGVGAKLFTIAGPVIVYGLVTAWLIGLIYYLFS